MRQGYRMTVRGEARHAHALILATKCGMARRYKTQPRKKAISDRAVIAAALPRCVSGDPVNNCLAVISSGLTGLSVLTSVAGQRVGGG